VSSHKDCGVEKSSRRRWEQKKEDRIEDINAAAVVYANYSKSRFQRQRCLRCQRKEEERREESEERLAP
jgi:hypothetical protein